MSARNSHTGGSVRKKKLKPRASANRSRADGRAGRQEGSTPRRLLRQFCSYAIIVLNAKSLHQYLIPDTISIPHNSANRHWVLRTTLCTIEEYLSRQPRAQPGLVALTSCTSRGFVESPAYHPSSARSLVHEHGSVFGCRCSESCLPRLQGSQKA